MSTPHTPGPWRVTTPNAGEGYNVFAGEDERIGHTIGYYPCRGSNERTLSREEAEANASLIAASPEMFALIDEAVSGLPEFDDDEEVSGADLVDWFCEWREKAKEVLKKAKGEA